MGASGAFEHRRAELSRLRGAASSSVDGVRESSSDVDSQAIEVSDSDVFDSFVAGAEPGEQFTSPPFSEAGGERFPFCCFFGPLCSVCSCGCVRRTPDELFTLFGEAGGERVSGGAVVCGG